jgi:hypothetical protein
MSAITLHDAADRRSGKKECIMTHETEDRTPVELGVASELTRGGPGIVTDFVRLQNGASGISDD